MKDPSRRMSAFAAHLTPAPAADKARVTIIHWQGDPGRPPGKAPSVLATSSTPRLVQRDAIIFIPGIGSLEPSLTHFTEALCNEFDRAAKTETAHFAVHSSTIQSGNQVEVVRKICRIDGDESSPVADIYGIDQDTIQQADITPANPLLRAVTLALTVLAGALIWLMALLPFRSNRKVKPITQMLQLLACLVILLILCAYLFAAIVAVIQLAMTAYATATGSTPRTITWPQVFVIITAVLGALLPGARDRLWNAAEQYLRVMRYLWVAGPRNNLRGEVLTLLEHASERREVGRIHLVGLSFGSLVAIDTVFPASKPPTARMSRVTSLTTIGCAFDLVRMLQPRYFKWRFAVDNAAPLWINIYDPIDVLGSNFRDDHEQDKATKGVEIIGSEGEKGPDHNYPWNPGQRLTPVSGLMLASLRVHFQYWGANPHAESALGYLVSTLFDGTPALR